MTTVGFGDSVVPTTTLGRAVVMPYAIIGILSLGLVISSIRTVVVERARVRKALIHMLIKRREKHLHKARKHKKRKQAEVMGVSLMLMGPHAMTIHERSLDGVDDLEREETIRRQTVELHAERWKEFYDLGVALGVFLVDLL